MTTIAAQTLGEIDESNINKSHWRMVLTAGMGFFTDAYDLFIIGTVTALLKPIWGLSTADVALLNGASLIAAALGAMLFGYFADKFGRKKMYGLEVLILFFGAIISALAPSFIFLLISRVIVGFGIGGDYPTSAVIASEYSNRKNRGYLVLMVFAMQALGLIVGPLLASLFLALHIPHEWTWRLLLLLGAVPAFSVFYMRRKLAETPRFKQQSQYQQVSRVVRDLTREKKPKRLLQIKQHNLLSKKWLLCLLGTAGSWFLLDVALYGNGISMLLIMDKLNPTGSLLHHLLLSMSIFIVFAVPGYFLAAKYVDTIGRKKLQIFGFVMIAICYLAIAIIPGLKQHMLLFTIVFGLSFFFTNFGPNTTTFLIPSEAFPTSIRARAHGISAGLGKIGAFVAALAFPFMVKGLGISITFASVGAIAVIGAALTLILPEMKQRSIDETEI